MLFSEFPGSEFGINFFVRNSVNRDQIQSIVLVRVVQPDQVLRRAGATLSPNGLEND